MKEIIPLKKQIIFKSMINEVTSINVEHDYKIKDDLVDGKLLLNGTYKMTEASLIEEEFYYEVPFSVSLADDIDKESVRLEIEDFKYDYNKDVMNVNAQFALYCEKNETNNLFENYFNDDVKDIDTSFDTDKEYSNNDLDITNNKKEDNDDITIKDNEIENHVNNIKDNIINNISDNIIKTKDKYNTYKVYIVRDNDNIDTICNKYNLKINDLSEYNDINNINVGDKVIIPYIDE